MDTDNALDGPRASDGQRAVDGPSELDGLISTLDVIDQQPLDQRATAFAQIHDELRAVLDNPGSSPR